MAEGRELGDRDSCAQSFPTRRKSLLFIDTLLTLRAQISSPGLLAAVEHADDPAACIGFADPVGLAVGDADIDDVPSRAL